MILAHPRLFYTEDDIQLSVVVKLQILKMPFWKIRQVAGDKIILLGPQDKTTEDRLY